MKVEAAPKRSMDEGKGRVPLCLEGGLTSLELVRLYHATSWHLGPRQYL